MILGGKRFKVQTKPQLSNNGDNRGKRKMSDSIVGEGDEAVTRYRSKGGHPAKQSGGVLKIDNNGSGIAAAGDQPRQLQ